MRAFYLMRYEDHSGISGEGKVAEGVEWDDGTVAMRWCDLKRSPHGVTIRPTTVLHDDVESVIALHGHNGKTHLVWHEVSPDGSE